MNIVEKLDFEKAKSTIGKNYLPVVDFLEGIEIIQKLTDDNKYRFLFKDLIHHHVVEVSRMHECFTIYCKKEKNKKEMAIEIITLNKKYKDYDLDVLRELLKNKYNVDFNLGCSKLERTSEDGINVLYCFFEFNDILTVEQIGDLYQGLFAEEGVDNV